MAKFENVKRNLSDRTMKKALNQQEIRMEILLQSKINGDPILNINDDESIT